jgi:hypothetical protein
MTRCQDYETHKRESRLWLERNEIPYQKYRDLPTYNKVVPCNMICIPTRPKPYREPIALHKKLCLPDIAGRESIVSESFISIERLANVFKVSIRAAAWRIAEVSTEPCIAPLWKPHPNARSKALRLAWREGPGKKSRGKINYMPVHTLVRYPSKLHQAYENDTPVRSFNLFELNTVTKRCPMESRGFGRNETRNVISLAFPDR